MLHLADEIKNAGDFLAAAAVSAAALYTKLHPILVDVSVTFGIIWYSIRIGEWAWGKFKGKHFNPLDH